MLYREFQRRFYHLLVRIRSKMEGMREAARRPSDFLRALTDAAQIQIVGMGMAITILVGSLGYMILEGWDIIDATYMTVITLTTVGYGEVGGTLSSEGRLFTIFIIITGVGLITYGFSSAIEYVATGQVMRQLELYEKQKRLYTMQNHYIIGGFGRVGREVAMAFANEHVPFVIVDANEQVLSDASALGYVTVLGSVVEDDVLKEAGVERAEGIVVCAGDDATNVYAVLTARGLNPGLQIIARVTDVNSEAKVLRAGADRVISPYVLSGRRMAHLAIRPHVVDFLDITAASSEIEQALEEVVVEDGSIIVNQTIGQLDLRRRTGANILALYLPTGEWLSNPTTSTILEPGTRLILLGNRDQLDVTDALARSLTNTNEETT